MHVDILLCAVFVACLCVTLLPHSNVPRGVQAHVSHIDESLVSETVYTVCLSAEGVRQAGVGEGKLRVGVIGCWLLLAGFVVPRFPKPNLRSRSMITFLPQLMIRRDKTWHFALRCRPASFARSLHYAMAHDGGTPGFAHGASETTMEVLRRLRRQEGFSKMQAVGGAAPGLFIGPQIASRDVSALAQHGITHILGLNGRSPMISTLVKVILRGGHAGGLCGSASHGTAGVKQGLTVKVVHMEDSPGVLRARALLACLHCVSQPSWFCPVHSQMRTSAAAFRSALSSSTPHCWIAIPCWCTVRRAYHGLPRWLWATSCGGTRCRMARRLLK